MVKHSVHKLEQLFLVRVFNGCFVVNLVCFWQTQELYLCLQASLNAFFMNLKTNGLIFSFQGDVSCGLLHGDRHYTKGRLVSE